MKGGTPTPAERWRALFCTCGEDQGDPACLGCHALRVLRHEMGSWAVSVVLQPVERRLFENNRAEAPDGRDNGRTSGALII